MKILSKIFCFGLLFFYLYSISFRALPLSLGSRVYISLSGFSILFIQSALSFERIGFFGGYFKRILIALIVIAIVALISILSNQTSDLEFVKYVISMILIVGAAYLVCICFNEAFYLSAKRNLVLGIIICVAVQCALALAIFFSEVLKDFLLNLVTTSDFEEELISSTGEFRLIGFGSAFFGAGITNGVALLLIAYYIRHLAQSRLSSFVLGVTFLFISVAGILMSRSTVVGLLVASGYLSITCLVGVSNSPEKLATFFVLGIFSSVVAGTLTVFFLIDTSVLEPMLNWAFEPIINYFSGDGLTSESTDQLIDMYRGADISTIPWLLGDGLFYDLTDPGKYYMGVDVGYLRLVYYFGIPGLLAYLFFQISGLMATLDFFSKDRIFVLCILATLILLNFKGFADFFMFSVLFFIMHSFDDRKLKDLT